MRVIFLPDVLTIILCFLVWPVLQVTAALVCLYLPDRYFSPDSFFFRAHRFEKEGRIYDSVFRVSRWKHLLPDGGAILKKRGFKKKKLKDHSKENLNRFLVESARGEITHWLAILPFWVFGFFTPPRVIWYMFVYALLVNLPCIIAQRYNRPRVLNLLNRMEHKNQINYFVKSEVTAHETNN
jgi:glycosyl-4,4'-diaponeurosporenoate acyltransferase